MSAWATNETYPNIVPDFYVINAVKGLDAGYIILCGLFILLQQLGFSQLEVGLSRVANIQNVFMKNLLVACTVALMYFIVGYGETYGVVIGTSPNGFIGTAGWGLINVRHLYAFFIQFCFALNACSVYTHALAGRTRVFTYLTLAVVVSGFLYPVLAHWVWSPNGWIFQLGATGSIDFSGGGVRCWVRGRGLPLVGDDMH